MPMRTMLTYGASAALAFGALAACGNDDDSNNIIEDPGGFEAPGDFDDTGLDDPMDDLETDDFGNNGVEDFDDFEDPIIEDDTDN